MALIEQQNQVITHIQSSASPSGKTYDQKGFTVFMSDLDVTKVSKNSPRVDGKLVLKPQPYTLVKVKRKSEPYTVIHNVIVGDTTYYSSKQDIQRTWYPISLNLWKTAPAIARDKAILKWYNEVSSQKTNILEMYATRQQTVDMITGAARSIAKAARDLRRGDLQGAGRHLGIGDFKPKSQNFSGRWLELQYGWLPLIGSIHAVIDEPSLPLTRVVTCRATETVLYEVKEYPQYDLYQKGSFDLKVRVTAQGRITLSDTALANAQAYGITNPLLLAWELLPYSFVVDWFLPIGNYLNALTALSGVVVSDANVTTTHSFNGYWTTVGGKAQPLFASVIPGTNRMDYINKVRTLGMPSVPIPRVKSPISTTHALNAIALLAEAFKRSK